MQTILESMSTTLYNTLQIINILLGYVWSGGTKRDKRRDGIIISKLASRLYLIKLIKLNPLYLINLITEGASIGIGSCCPSLGNVIVGERSMHYQPKSLITTRIFRPTIHPDLMNLYPLHKRFNNSLQQSSI